MGNTYRKLLSCSCFKKTEEKKSARERQPEGTQDAAATAPTYETVADFPVYAVVNKNRPKKQVQEESVQYAEIQVIQLKSKSKGEPARKPQQQEATEYATLNFPKAYNSRNGTLV